MLYIFFLYEKGLASNVEESLNAGFASLGCTRCIKKLDSNRDCLN
jgi:hypothetical protein